MWREPRRIEGAGAGVRRWALLRSVELQPEEGVRGRREEVHPARIVEHAGVALEALGQSPVGRGCAPGFRPRVLRDELIGLFALGDVKADARHAPYTLGEDSRHEQRVVSDVASHADLVLGAEVR